MCEARAQNTARSLPKDTCPTCTHSAAHRLIEAILRFRSNSHGRFAASPLLLPAVCAANDWRAEWHVAKIPAGVAQVQGPDGRNSRSPEPSPSSSSTVSRRSHALPSP
ncbi:hypothetical protein V2G26_004966 [Clonostachys chloroleuca]